MRGVCRCRRIPHEAAQRRLDDTPRPTRSSTDPSTAESRRHSRRIGSHLYTGTHGRVNAVVKGVRRTKSRFGGRLEPFFRVRLVLYEGRGELHTVTQAEAIEWYPRLREHGGAILRRRHRVRVGAAAVRRRARRTPPRTTCSATSCSCSTRGPRRRAPANLLAFRLKLLLAAGFLPELSACAAAARRSRAAARSASRPPRAG